MASGLTAAEAESLRAFEQRGHDALAENYYGFFTPVTANAIDPLLDAVQARAGTRLLDVATGPGAVAAAAHRRGARATGVDLSSKMVALAQGLHPGIDFQQADVEHLPFDDGAFDAVVCCFGLGHFPLPEVAVAECLRVLRPGGQLAFAWWDQPERQRIQALFREAAAEVGVTPPAGMPLGHSSLRFSDPDEFLRLLRGAGIVNAMLSEYAGSYRTASADALWRGGVSSLVLASAAIRAQDAATQERIRDAFTRRAQVYADADGLRVPIAFRIGSGRKPD